MILPHEQALLDSGRATLETLMVNYRTLFHLCWEQLTDEQQADVNALLAASRLIQETEVTDG